MLRARAGGAGLDAGGAGALGDPGSRPPLRRRRRLGRAEGGGRARAADGAGACRARGVGSAAEAALRRRDARRLRRAERRGGRRARPDRRAPGGNAGRPRAGAGRDPATRVSLEIERSLGGSREGSLLGAIDRTVTAPGARALAARLARPLMSPEAIDARLDAIEWLLGRRTLRQKL